MPAYLSIRTNGRDWTEIWAVEKDGCLLRRGNVNGLLPVEVGREREWTEGGHLPHLPIPCDLRYLPFPFSFS